MTKEFYDKHCDHCKHLRWMIGEFGDSVMCCAALRDRGKPIPLSLFNECPNKDEL